MTVRRVGVERQKPTTEKRKRIPPLRSAPLARLEWLFVAADPSGRIERLGHALTKQRMRPIRGMFHKTMHAREFDLENGGMRSAFPPYACCRLMWEDFDRTVGKQVATAA
jgi:hypothetical protein